jgi:hemoglobin
MKEIENIEDIQLLVNDFYGRIREDELLGPIFDSIIQNRWDEHLEKMYRFWQTVLLDEHTYYGAPFVPHAKIDLYEFHFEHWRGIWFATVDSHFFGENAEKAKAQGDRMASIFNSKIDYIRENNISF